jgi:hypothetical protein
MTVGLEANIAVTPNFSPPEKTNKLAGHMRKHLQNGDQR